MCDLEKYAKQRPGIVGRSDEAAIFLYCLATHQVVITLKRTRPYPREQGRERKRTKQHRSRSGAVNGFACNGYKLKKKTVLWKVFFPVWRGCFFDRALTHGTRVGEADSTSGSRARPFAGDGAAAWPQV